MIITATERDHSLLNRECYRSSSPYSTGGLTGYPGVWTRVYNMKMWSCVFILGVIVDVLLLLLFVVHHPSKNTKKKHSILLICILENVWIFHKYLSRYFTWNLGMTKKKGQWNFYGILNLEILSIEDPEESTMREDRTAFDRVFLTGAVLIRPRS